MMINVVKIDWNDINKAVPAFLTISIMPLTYSISYGARPLTPMLLHPPDISMWSHCNALPILHHVPQKVLCLAQ